MSNDLAADWLLHGIAAAQANDKEEARLCLEHALIELDVMAETYGEIDPKAREDAWYWLSRVMDDPKQRREYLENVLASNPGHPEARRDLAILDGRLKPEEIVNPEKASTPVAPPSVPAPEDVRRYVCPRCGGKLTYDAGAHALACQYCGYHVAEAEAGTIAAHDFVATVYTARAHRWELPEARVATCKGCGAHFTVPPAQATGTCPFCGSAYIIESANNGELIEPGGVVPFQFDEEGATQHVRQWLGSRNLSPDDLKQARIARPRPVYFPFWLFEMGGEIRWHGLVPVREAVNEQVVWIQQDGSELVMSDSELVPASHSLPNELVSALSRAPAG